MTAILNLVLPVFAIILAGYLSGRLRLLGDASSEALNGFVYYGALPALFFISLARIDIAGAINWPFIAALGGSMLATLLVAVAVAVFAFPNRPAAYGVHGLSAIFSNTGYMGIPLLIIVFGESGTLPAILGTMLTGTVIFPIGVAIIEIDLGRGAGALAIARRVVLAVARNPMVMSAAAGLLVAIPGLTVPVPIATFSDLMAAAAGPCALFAIGLFLVGRTKLVGIREVGWLVGLKLLVQPAIAWWLAFHVFTMPPVWAASAVILSALPTGSLVFVLAQRYDIYVQRATAAILLSTVISVVTLSALFVALGVG